MDYRREKVYIVVAVSFLIQVVLSCDMQTVLDALETCRTTREQLNSVAARHDTNQSDVCRVFEAFAHCMDPQVGGCEGESTEAYRAQRQIYTGPLYNCTVWSSGQASNKPGHLLTLSLFTAFIYTYL